MESGEFDERLAESRDIRYSQIANSSGMLTEGKDPFIVIITVVLSFIKDLIGSVGIVLLFLLPRLRNDPTHVRTVKIGHCFV